MTMDEYPAVLDLPPKAPSPSCSDEQNDEDEPTPTPYNFLERQARRVARWPKTHLWTAIVLAVALSVFGMLGGDFYISFDNFGWPSRGTLVANRQSQFLLISRNKKKLAMPDNEELWKELTTNVQLGWEVPSKDKNKNQNNKENNNAEENNATQPPLHPTDPSPTDIISLLENCDVKFYADMDFVGRRRLWPVWKVTNKTASALDPDLLQSLCEAEEETQAMLHKEGLCFGCEASGQCLPPLGIVFYARIKVGNGLGLNCQELAQAWAPLKAETEQEWKDCIRHQRSVTADFAQDRGPCTTFFSPSMVDDLFDQTGRVAYTSSIFVTHHTQDKELYKLAKDFDRLGSDQQILGAYDTQLMTFREYGAKDSVPHDAALVAGSVIMTTLAMLVHTRSPFLTLVGIFEISLSFPLAFTVYRFIGGITWFPFLNLVGLFVGFALGADHVFVAVDKWKNRRIDSPPEATTEDIAGKALPSAGKAMLLTTLTTAIAFFGSSMCPVLPIKLFAIFVGLLIVIDYILDVVVMFPCLCIYDSYRNKRNCFMSIQCSGAEDRPRESSSGFSVEEEKKEEEVKEEEEEVDPSDFTKRKQESSVAVSEDVAPTPQDSHNLIRCILLSFYGFLHKWRWILLVLSLAALAVCSYFATTLSVPVTSSDMQILGEDTQYEQAAQWRNELLSNELLALSGGLASVVWGITPADTGNHLDPWSWSTLELDESFDPTSESAQVFMRDYCENFFAEDFAAPPTGEAVCAFNRFDEWLQSQSRLPLEYQNQTYTEHCDRATAIPVSKGVLHPCLSAWAQQEEDQYILSRDGVVKVVRIAFNSRVRYNSPQDFLSSEWHAIENWMQSQDAPPGMTNAYFTSFDWWFWDTSNAVYQTVISSGAIAIVVSSMAILVSSKSVSMTIFSALSVAYVLLSVSSMMAAAHWTLGFL